MKVEHYKMHQQGHILNVKIKNAIDKLVNKYINDRWFIGYTREEIYDVVIDECIQDCKDKTNFMLDITLGEHTIPYLQTLKKQNKVKETPLFTM